MPEVVARLRALGHDISTTASKVVARIHGPERPTDGFRDQPSATRWTASNARISATRRSPAPGRLPDPAKFIGNAAERAILLNELYASLRRRIEIFISLPFATLDRMALKARLDEIGGDPTAGIRTEPLSNGCRYQRNGPHRPARAPRRAGWCGARRRRPACRQPARCRPRQRTEGRRGHHSASAGIRQHSRPLARADRRGGRPRAA